MRSNDFINEKLSPKNTGGLTCSDWCFLLENEMAGIDLFESLDQNAIQYLTSLSSYSASGQIGQNYVPVFIMLLPEPENRIAIYGINHLVQLFDIRQEKKLTVYDFDNAGLLETWPLTRLSALSFSQLYLFDNKDNFEKFRTAISIRFTSTVFEADFT